VVSSSKENPVSPRIPVDPERIASFCRRNGIRRLALFGSVLRDDFGPGSDIDVLVAFEPTQRVGFFAIARLESELSEILGRKVDLRTMGDLSRYIREEVSRSSVVQFEARDAA